MSKTEKIDAIRHSLSHLMSMAIMEKYPQAGLAVGPSIENGFYQDYDLPEPISENDFAWIEERMREMIAQNIKFIQKDSDFESALEFYKHDPYKTEMINELKAKGEKKVSFYDSDWFHNLCAGPHVESTSEINPDTFKLDKIAGAYWRGDEKNKMLQRIYGLAFETKEELETFLHNREEAEKRDHRKIGKDLDLFVFSDLIGKGLPLFTAKGATIRRELERFAVDEEINRGYEHVITPHLAKVDLYRTSGHYPYYKDTMYPSMQIDEEELILRPMTCPHHFMLYKSKLRSYKDLPLRFAEVASQFRYEKSGELSGLTRVRFFCLADSHIFTPLDQAKKTIGEVLDLIEYANTIFGLKKGVDFRYRLSLGDRKDEKKYYKDDKAWDEAEEILRSLLKERKEPFFEAPGEAAFYGPKIDIQMKKISGAEETAFTVQYDFVMPKRFDLKYIDVDGTEKQPIVVHRSSIGCIERTMAFLIEFYNGAFPLWLSPTQVKILSISEKQKDFANEILLKLKKDHIRAEVDLSDESLGKKIRNAEIEKVPVIWIIGDKEVETKQISQRLRKDYAEKIKDGSMDLDKVIDEIKKCILEKK